MSRRRRATQDRRGQGDPVRAPSDPRPVRERALALYTPPFTTRYDYVFDGAGNMIADYASDPSNPLRVRGWGRICYLPDPEALQDTVEAFLEEAGATAPGLTAAEVADRLTTFWQESTCPAP
jgi:hypothetical protein